MTTIMRTIGKTHRPKTGIHTYLVEVDASDKDLADWERADRMWEFSEDKELDIIGLADELLNAINEYNHPSPLPEEEEEYMNEATSPKIGGSFLTGTRPLRS